MPQILVIDDNAMTREFLSSVLTFHGYEVRTAINGGDALEKIREEHPDLIITDLLMPNMDGYEFVEELQKNASTKDLKVIFYTATYAQHEALALAKACGAFAVLEKPAEISKILSLVKQALGETLGSEVEFLEPSAVGSGTGDVATFLDQVPLVTHFQEGDKQDKFMRLTAALTAERSLERMLQLACRGIREVMGSSYCALGILANDQKTILHYYIDNKMPYLVQNEKPRLHEGLIKKTLQEKKKIRLPNLQSVEKTQLGIPDLFSVGDFFLLPIMTPTTLYGFLCLIKEQNTFKEEEIKMLEMVVQQMAMLYETNLLFIILQRHSVSLQLEMSSHKKIEAALVDGDSIFRQFSDNISDVFWVISPAQKIIYVSKAFENIWGWSIDSLYSDPTVWMEAVDLRDKDQVKKHYQKLIQEKKSLAIEYRVIRPDKSTRYVYDRGFPVLDEHDTLTHIIGITTDITNKKKAEKLSEIQYLVSQIFAESENVKESTIKALRVLCENSGWKFAMLWMLDQSSSKLNCVAFWHSSGVKMEHLENLDGEKTLASGVPSRIVKEKRAVWIEDLHKNTSLPEMHYRGSDKIRSVCGFPVVAEGEILGVIEFFSDKIFSMDEGLFELLKNIGSQIGQFIKRKHSEEQLERMAHYDILTGLANRSVLFHVIKEDIHSARLSNKMVALLFVDLDNFKQINDKHGHEVGDAFLKIVGERLKARVRKPDTVARLGGDEFVIILSNIAKIEAVTTVAEKIREAVSNPFFVKGNEFAISASIGISLYPNDGEDAQTLLSKADVAMYEAKESGGNKYQFCTTEMAKLANEKSELEQAMRQGLEQNEFVLLYQPKIDLHLRKVTGVEALLYWQRNGEILPPKEFLQLAEETGFIIPLGEWVLKTACEQTKRWHKQGFPLAVSINLSSNQLIMGEFLDSIVYVLKESKLSPEFLEVELTESLLMKHLEASLTLIRALRSLEVQIALDDFGTGFSSLMYLKQFKMNRLKIDKSFVQGLPKEPSDMAIARTIISMAHSLGVKAVAEGVERKDQLNFLLDAGCDEMQGYYFSRPITADKIIPLLQHPPTIM